MARRHLGGDRFLSMAVAGIFPGLSRSARHGLLSPLGGCPSKSERLPSLCTGYAELLRKNWSVAQLLHVLDAIAYPLPVLVLITPLTILPLELAVYVWFFVLIGCVVVFTFAFEWKRPIFCIIPLLTHECRLLVMKPFGIPPSYQGLVDRR